MVDKLTAEQITEYAELQSAQLKREQDEIDNEALTAAAIEASAKLPAMTPMEKLNAIENGLVMVTTMGLDSAYAIRLVKGTLAIPAKTRAPRGSADENND